MRRLVFPAGVVFLFSLAASAQVYSYVDAAGVTHFTNRPRGDARFKHMHLKRGLANDRRAGRGYQVPKRYEWDLLIGTTARAQGVSPALVKAVVAAESAFNPLAVSHKGAQGLMQLMPKTAAGLGVMNPMEPEQNLRGGVSYLRAMIDRFGDLNRALAAYNAGPTAVVRYGGVPPFPETRDYVERVLTYYRSYHGDFP